MTCIKCKIELLPDSNYCHMCGKKQVRDKRRGKKSRGNGQGSVYQLPNKSWRAEIVLHYYTNDEGKRRPKTATKSGFKTKSEAIAYLPTLQAQRAGGKKEKKRVTFKQLYDAWIPTHQADRSTLNCYKAAFKHLSAVHDINMDDLDIDDLQACLDECEKGKRTKQLMKTACGLIYKYGIPRNAIRENLNLASFLIVRGDDAPEKDALPEDAVEKIFKLIGEVFAADYVYAQCFLGFRPSELLSLDVSSYNAAEKAFIGGAKTDAGRDRVVTVSPKIQPIIDRLVADKDIGPVFCAEDGGRLSLKDYRELFYAVLAAAGVENPIINSGGVERHKYTPHSCRRTFATKMKRVEGANKDKLALIGHTSDEMLRYYQDVSYEDLRSITNSL